jgi:hypothetical protein
MQQVNDMHGIMGESVNERERAECTSNQPVKIALHLQRIKAPRLEFVPPLHLGENTSLCTQAFFSSHFLVVAPFNSTSAPFRNVRFSIISLKMCACCECIEDGSQSRVHEIW